MKPGNENHLHFDVLTGYSSCIYNDTAPMFKTLEILVSIHLQMGVPSTTLHKQVPVCMHLFI
jgi:hypothetical protein